MYFLTIEKGLIAPTEECFSQRNMGLEERLSVSESRSKSIFSTFSTYLFLRRYVVNQTKFSTMLSMALNGSSLVEILEF